MDKLLSDFVSTPVSEVRPAALLINLTLAAILASLLRRVYIHCGTSLSNRRQFANNFLLLACTTTLIIAVVKSSLALSLGLVGALSIVRFRSAIKEPEELAYLFLTIGIGLGLGAEQWRITVPAFALITGFIYLGYRKKREHQQENLLLTVASSVPETVNLEQIVGVLRHNCSSVNLQRFDEHKDVVEASFSVVFDDYQQLEASKRELRQLDNMVQLSFVDNVGIL